MNKDYEEIFHAVRGLRTSIKNIVWSIVQMLVFFLLGLLLTMYFNNDVGIIVGTLFSVCKLGMLFSELRFNNKISSIIGKGGTSLS